MTIVHPQTKHSIPHVSVSGGMVMSVIPCSIKPAKKKSAIDTRSNSTTCHKGDGDQAVALKSLSSGVALMPRNWTLGKTKLAGNPENFAGFGTEETSLPFFNFFFGKSL